MIYKSFRARIHHSDKFSMGATIIYGSNNSDEYDYHMTETSKVGL